MKTTNMYMKNFKNFTFYKIMENSLPKIVSNMGKCTMPNNDLGRWKLNNCNKKDDLNNYYANTDHCGDSICGSPQVLKSKYPEMYNNQHNKNKKLK